MEVALELGAIKYHPWEARWAENPEGRPRQKLEHKKKIKNKKIKKEGKIKRKMKSSQGWKPERAALAKVRAQKESVNTRENPSQNYVGPMIQIGSNPWTRGKKVGCDLDLKQPLN